MTVVLHIGSPKTGTTAIQRFADANRAALRSRGLWYPSYREAGLSVSHYAHHDAFHAVGAENQKLSAADMRTFFAHVAAKRKPGETVLLSAEPVYRYVIEEGKVKGPRLRQDAFWEARARYLEALREALPFEDLRILLYLRRQEDFAPSFYQENVKVTLYPRPFSRFIQDRRHLFSYFRQVKALRSTFDHVDVRYFGDLTGGAGLARNFFRDLGVDVTDFDREGLRNVSLPIALTEFKRLVNRSGLSRAQVEACGKALLELAEEPQWSEGERLSWLPGKEMAAFSSRFEAGNRKLAELYPGRGLEALSEPGRGRDAKVFEGLAPQTVVTLAARTMIDLASVKTTVTAGR